jgi:hypothetical protein
MSKVDLELWPSQRMERGWGTIIPKGTALNLLNEDEPMTEQRNWMRFRLSTLLLLVTVAALTIALVMTQRRLSQLESESLLRQPLSVAEVAKQFANQTSRNSIKTKVTDVRYSPKEDVYRVSFSWYDPTSKQNWSTEIRLKADGFGRYYGTIESDPYKQSLGLPTTDVFSVVVEAPSAFKP